MVLWAGGISLLLVALFYFVIDVAEFHRWAFPPGGHRRQCTTSVHARPAVRLDGRQAGINRTVPFFRPLRRLAEFALRNRVFVVASLGKFSITP